MTDERSSAASEDGYISLAEMLERSISMEITVENGTTFTFSHEQLNAARAALAAAARKPDWCQGADSICHHPACVCVIPNVAQPTRDQIYAIVLRELETKHPVPTTVLLATRIANALAAQPPAAPVETDAEAPEGHDKPCYYCGESCNAYAGNPGLWPIPLCHSDDPGRVKWHHTNCVSERLIENQPHRGSSADIGGEDIIVELDRLRLKAFASNSEVDRAAYFDRVSRAYQRGELVSSAKPQTLSMPRCSCGTQPKGSCPECQEYTGAGCNHWPGQARCGVCGMGFGPEERLT